MEDTAKYLIHADFVVDGVVERSDVVGAAFGQTEGLLGDDLAIPDLQDSAKLGRIDVSVDSEGGQSFGDITIASSLDRVETATLAAALEAVERIGPCRADVEVDRIEDVRAAKRREVVDRAKELLATAFDEGAINADDILDEVRESVRVDDITDYDGYPAGPNVDSSDAVVIVEGRADVVTLLKYGIKNAVAVEGTNIPDAIAALSREKTATAFLDGDRGGDMILRELGQVGSLDFVARAPTGECVEDLSRRTVDSALRNKTPASAAAPIATTQSETAATDGSATPAPTPEPAPDTAPSPDSDDDTEAAAPPTLAEHARAVADTETARLLDDALARIREVPAAEVVDAVADADSVPAVVVVDATITQRLLDVAAQRGVASLIGADTDEFVKQPLATRVRTLDDART
ncbi:MULTISPECIES: DNA primase DnaG [Halobacterium]|uniref:DNA primase DnaG n=1 Tax=Halobacterium TaxID=2239 RepID=UPI0019656838|nr:MULTISPECIES: DNA primase DnaG [Halobacterium]MDL0123296.1 DNA primase DnaG [Halobacterium salinarum]MDL0124614.1 DNA primase DnaG [Halobacterium salinarum]QRY24148.1 DNA primase [Halobacterium sp. BOL4-2]